MKKFYLLLFSSILSIFSFAGGAEKGEFNQWVVVGLRGTFNSTWLLNQNQLKDKGLKYQASWGWSAGAMLGFHYTSWGAIYVEGLYSVLSQKQASNIDSLKWNSKRNLTYYEIPVLLHFNTSEFKYIETGISYGMLANARSSYSSSAVTYSNQNAKDYFAPNNMAFVFGWGAAMWGDGGGLVNLGIRLTYGLTDIVTNAGGKGIEYSAVSDGATPKPKSYLPTHTATVGFHLTYDFDMGWFAYNGCKRKYKFFMFHH